MKTAILFVSCATLLGCSHPEERTVAAGPAALQMDGEVSMSEQQANTRHLPKDTADLIEELSICATINKAVVGLANSADAGRYQTLIRTNAHQSAIYVIYIGDLLQPLPEDMIDKGMGLAATASQDFVANEIQGKHLSGAYLNEIHKNHCQFQNEIMKSSQYLMDEYPLEYEEQYDSIVNYNMF